MGFGGFFKAIGKGVVKGGDKALDVAQVFHFPLVEEAADIRDVVKSIVNSDGPVDREKLVAVAARIDALSPQIVSAVQQAVDVVPPGAVVGGKAPLESKKFLALSGGLIAIAAGLIATKLGVDAELVKTLLGDAVNVLMAYLAAQGAHDAVTALRK